MMEFVRMCRVALEIQEQWKPRSGDLYHYNCAINPLRPLVVSPDVHGFRMEWSYEFFKNCFWVPRQEDLQRLYKNHFKICDEMVIIYDLELWVKPKGKPVQKLYPAINVMWLCFLMETIYNKRWNGTEWEEL